jgi:hypothetical protein
LLIGPLIEPGVAGVILTNFAGEAAEIPQAFWLLTTRLSFAVKDAEIEAEFAPITLLENVVVAAPDQLYWVVPETKATVNVLVAPELTHVAPAITPGAVGFKLT